MPTKTAKIGNILETANMLLAPESCFTPEEKRGVAMLLESILQESGNYEGYSYKARDTDGNLLYTDGHGNTRHYHASKKVAPDYMAAYAERHNNNITK